MHAGARLLKAGLASGVNTKPSLNPTMITMPSKKEWKVAGSAYAMNTRMKDRATTMEKDRAAAMKATTMKEEEVEDQEKKKHKAIMTMRQEEKKNQKKQKEKTCREAEKKHREAEIHTWKKH
jgi:hypothetical protein